MSLGAGKTTLVDILAGKCKVGKSTGTVKFFDHDENVIKRPRIGFVDQVCCLVPIVFGFRLHYSSPIPFRPH